MSERISVSLDVLPEKINRINTHRPGGMMEDGEACPLRSNSSSAFNTNHGKGAACCALLFLCYLAIAIDTTKRKTYGVMLSITG